MSPVGKSTLLQDTQNFSLGFLREFQFLQGLNKRPTEFLKSCRKIKFMQQNYLSLNVSVKLIYPIGNNILQDLNQKISYIFSFYISLKKLLFSKELKFSCWILFDNNRSDYDSVGMSTTYHLIYGFSFRKMYLRRVKKYFIGTL